MIQLIYTSTAAVPLNGAELTRLLRKSRENNELLDLTGILLYHQDSFIQVLEGPENAVESTFAKICDDPRHRWVQMLCQASISRPVFPDWPMGFVHLQRDCLKEFSGFSDFFGCKGRWSASQGATALRLLTEFRYGHWRRKVDLGRPALAMMAR